MNGLIQYVRVMTAKAGHFLPDSRFGVRDQFPVAAIPQLVSVRQGALHPTAGGLEDVLAEQFCIKGRQLDGARRRWDAGWPGGWAGLRWSLSWTCHREEQRPCRGDVASRGRKSAHNRSRQGICHGAAENHARVR